MARCQPAAPVSISPSHPASFLAGLLCSPRPCPARGLSPTEPLRPGPQCHPPSVGPQRWPGSQCTLSGPGWLPLGGPARTPAWTTGWFASLPSSLCSTARTPSRSKKPGPCPVPSSSSLPNHLAWLCQQRGPLNVPENQEGSRRDLLGRGSPHSCHTLGKASALNH